MLAPFARTRQGATVAIAAWLLGSSATFAGCHAPRSGGEAESPRVNLTYHRMADGKEWTTANLDVARPKSWCYDDAPESCRRYGRLYSWTSAKDGCRSLGAGWRLPAESEWGALATAFGGASDHSSDSGRSAYAALMMGGRSGFGAVLGGGRTDDRFARLDAHRFHWTASEQDSASATFYNFGKGGLALHRQPGGDKRSAFSVRCVRG